MSDYQFNPNEEQWKAIPDFPGYEVSDHGRARSYWKSKGYGGGQKISSTSKILATNGSGYPRISLCKEGRYYGHHIHRLVLESFVSPCLGELLKKIPKIVLIMEVIIVVKAITMQYSQQRIYWQSDISSLLGLINIPLRAFTTLLSRILALSPEGKAGNIFYNRYPTAGESDYPGRCRCGPYVLPT